MKSIGGYFSLELHRTGKPYWLNNAIELNSSRHALEYILLSSPKNIGSIYVPSYTCEVVLEPIKRLGIKYHFYHINDQLELNDLPNIDKDDMIIVNNYFGIKDKYIDEITQYYGDKVIIDNAQAFYHITDASCRAIYSPRKFFGVPDGGYAITPDKTNIKLSQDFSTERTSHLLRRLDSGAELGYREFQINDSSLSNEPMKGMSNLTKSLLDSIDYNEIKQKRRRNFATLHKSLSEFNEFSIPDMSTFECPMIYPLLSHLPRLRERLIKNKIFVATYWPNVLKWCDNKSTEYKLTNNIIPLPIDQRYDSQDMETIIDIILG